MAKGLRLIVCAIGLFSAVAASASAQEPTLAWTLRLPDAQAKQPFVQSRGNDRCAAVVTATAVHVVSMNGEVMWSWNYRAFSRFLKPRLPYALEPLALSPSCDHVAMAGDSGYRYVWIAGRDAKAKAIQTVGTPLAIAFDLSGDYLAISTGSARGYLVTRDLEPRWSGHLRDFPIRWPEQVVAESVRTELIDFTKNDVDALLAVPPWGLWVSDSVSADGQWRVLAQSPHARADTWQMLAFYGPEGHAFHGRWEKLAQRARPRWSKPMGCLSADITPDGEFVMAMGDPRHPENHFGRDMTEIECHKEGAMTAFVFDRNGAVLFSRRVSLADGPPADVAETVRQTTGRPLTPAPEPDRYSGACEPARDGIAPLCLPGPNGLVITSRGNEIRAVRRR